MSTFLYLAVVVLATIGCGNAQEASPNGSRYIWISLGERRSIVRRDSGVLADDKEQQHEQPLHGEHWHSNRGSLYERTVDEGSQWFQRDTVRVHEESVEVDRLRGHVPSVRKM